MGMNNWMRKLSAFDLQICRMVESLTGIECEPKNGDDCYFFEANYRNHNNPDFILAMWDAIEGRAGSRLLEMKDDPERTVLLVRIKFQEDVLEEENFVPLPVMEQK